MVLCDKCSVLSPTSVFFFFFFFFFFFLTKYNVWKMQPTLLVVCSFVCILYFAVFAFDVENVMWI